MVDNFFFFFFFGGGGGFEPKLVLKSTGKLVYIISVTEAVLM